MSLRLQLYYINSNPNHIPFHVATLLSLRFHSCTSQVNKLKDITGPSKGMGLQLNPACVCVCSVY